MSVLVVVWVPIDGWARGCQLAAGRVLAVAAELDPAPRRFAVFATVLAEGVNRREIVTPDRRQILTPYSRCLKRQESFPVSMISQ